MFRYVFLPIIFAFTVGVYSQTSLQKIVDTEKAFAALAAEKGTKAAFLANMTDDALIFNPGRLNGKVFWNARPESKSLLSWEPNYADVNFDGSVGYTTGNWEFRQTKGNEPVGFGEFITVWLRQSDGGFKFVVDIGISHAKPSKYSTDWIKTKSKPDANKRNVSADTSIMLFTETVSKRGFAASLKTYAAGDIRLFREEQPPFIGKADAMSQAEREKGNLEYERFGTVSTYGNFAFFVKEYTFKDTNEKMEKGNAVQIWKFIGGKWRIVLDILKPVPAK